MVKAPGPQGPQSPRRKGAEPPRRTPLGRVLYWGTVVAVWGLIFISSLVVVFAWDLPDISKLYDVKRQPTISYLDRSGALISVRVSKDAQPLDLKAFPK